MSHVPRPELHIGEVTLSLDEAEEVLSAIRHGLVDAVVVEDGQGDQVLTFRDPSHPYRVLIEAMTEGAALVTFDGVICYHNPHLALALGRSDESLSGLTLAELVIPEQAEQVTRALDAAQTSATRLEVTLLGAERRVPVLLSLSPASLADIPVCCVVATDLTEHNRQEEQYLHARREIEARDRLVSIAAHELRGPLGILVLQTQRLSSMVRRSDGEAIMLPDAARLIRSVQEQSRQLATMVGKLLDLGSISRGGLTLELAECDLADVVRDVQALLEVPLRESGSTVDIQLQPARGLWDRARLVQVVTNLVTNALKYGGGTPISIRVGSDGQTARLVVEDRGPGIPVSERERVLRPYERVAGATSAQGLGLGLYITAEIVKAHRGTIRIEGEEGQGARFVIELPVTPA